VTPDGKAEGVWKSRRKKLVEDCLGVCLFAVMGVPGALGFDARAVAATVGWADFTVNELLTVGDRLSTMQRLFNIKRGLTKESDFDVGQRLLDAPKSGIAAGRAFGDHMVKMVEEYYQLEGWNPVTGEPLPETVERLGLTEVAKG
jgi:aldehyde:ferredoxin oxidoreductase